jgi:pimeloyl-ACP methyl ester carboxylesterase
MFDVVEHIGDVAGNSVHWREARGPGSRSVLYLHGVPTASWEWLPFLHRTGGVAPDLPGFGSSAKPASFEYTIGGYDRWLEAFTASVSLDRFSLVVHDWGAVGLALAQRFPERIERLVICACVPFLPGYRWHRIARAWRTPVVGELFMATTSRWGFRLISRESNVTPGPMPDSFIDNVWRDFDRPTRRAILRLYRSSPSEVLARAGRRLADLRCPTLVLWPTDDPYLGAEWGQRYADAIGGEVQLSMIERAGHWAWYDRPDIIDQVDAFLRTDA